MSKQVITTPINTVSVDISAIQEITTPMEESVINMLSTGFLNDEAEDNTDALVAAIALRKNTEPVVIEFPSGDWHFYGELPVNSHGTPTIFDNVVVRGVPQPMTTQHQEEGGDGDKQRTRFIIHLDADGDTWWYQRRDYRFGPVAFENITFQVADQGNVFQFGGDDQAAASAASLFRAIRFSNCIFTHGHQFPGDWPGEGENWLNDTSAYAVPLTDGYVLNRTYNTFAIKLIRGYDVTIENTSIRGFRVGISRVRCDRCKFDNIRGMLVGKLIDSVEVGSITVPDHMDNIYVEIPVFGGIVVTSAQIGRYRGEFGYNSGINPDVGVYPLPASVSWTIEAGGTTMSMTFAGDYDATDYFEPRTVIKITADQSGEPDRYLFITDVQPTYLTFYGSDSHCYVKRQISGTGNNVLRYFGNGGVIYGDMCSLMDPSISYNESNQNIPNLFIVPRATPIKVGGFVDTLSPNSGDSTKYPAVVASSVGSTFYVGAGVDWLGSFQVPNHPLVNRGGIGPDWNALTRDAEYYPDTQTQVFRPGRGVSGLNNESRDLQFHYITDSAQGKDIACYRLSDGSSSRWHCRKVRCNGVAATYRIRCYATQSATLSVYGGGGSSNTHSLSTGWNTVNSSLTSGQIVADANGAYIRLSGADIYVAWMTVIQNQ